MRRKILRISEKIFIELFGAGSHPGYKVVDDAIPEDAKIVDCRYDGFSGGAIEILLESDQFEEVKEGEEYPALVPTLRRIPDEEIKL